MKTDPERIAILEQQMIDVKDDVSDMKSDVKEILRTLNEAKGGWKGIMWIVGVSGAAGAILTKLISALPVLPRL